MFFLIYDGDFREGLRWHSFYEWVLDVVRKFEIKSIVKCLASSCIVSTWRSLSSVQFETEKRRLRFFGVYVLKSLKL